MPLRTQHMEEVEAVWREGGAHPPSDALMEKAAVQLEIPPRWMLWRVYHPVQQGRNDPWAKYYEEYEGGVKDEGRDLQVQWVSWDGGKGRYVHGPGSDPMDEEGFDEAASFPAFKPDRDLFGPPRRCRKQRGWHYIKRWSPATHAITYSPQEEYATGADIPPELVNHIVACFLGVSGGGVRLGTLRLVCRHWERLFLPYFFHMQVLRTHEGAIDRLAGLEQRRGWGWPAYPIRDLDLCLDVTRKPRGWIQIVKTKLLPMLDPFLTQAKMDIKGPLPAGQRLTSVYMSSPRRSPWRPLNIWQLTLDNLHFRKLDDLVRMLRELPFLAFMWGWRITWDSAPDVYPRATSFIPRQVSNYGSRNVTQYDFQDNPHLAAMLACALSPSGTSPITQPDADLLCTLASTLAPSRHSLSMRSYETIIIRNNTVHVGLVPRLLGSQPCTVQLIVLERVVEHYKDTSVAITWETVAGCVEKLSSRPNLFLVFSSLHSASVFHQDVATLNMPRLVAQGRVKYVVKKVEEEGVEDKENTWCLVEPNGDDSWRVLATERYTRVPNREPTVERVRELAARLPDH